MKILTFTSLYPNNEQASHGVFVENRLRQLQRHHPDVECKVVAPVPWFPSQNPVFGRYACLARVNGFEKRHGIDIWHPRFPVLPKIGMTLAPWLMYQSTRRCVRRLWDTGFDFDVIDAHYFYPDGVAAMWLAEEFERPFVVTGRGTDLTLIPQYRLPRHMIRDTARKAAHVITVAAALKSRLGALGIPDEHVMVLRNGVDLDFFRPAKDRRDLRNRLGYGARPTLLSAGHLIERKGHHLVIEALRAVKGVALLIAGDGPEERMLRKLVKQYSLQDRVRFLGRLSQENLREHYQAADILVLASSREGWANVLLEAMACGTPAVATPVDGTPEVITEPAAGILTSDRSATAISSAIAALRAGLPDRADTRRYAERFSWEETARGQYELLSRVISRWK